MAGLRQAGGHADHVLLGHPHVEEPVGEALGEWLEHREAHIAAEEDDARITLGQPEQLGDERGAHG